MRRWLLCPFGGVSHEEVAIVSILISHEEVAIVSIRSKS